MLLKTDAVVLKNSKFGEGNTILTLFSKKLGKLQAVSKGTRSTKNRYSHGAQLFSYGEFILFKGRELYQVSQFDMKDSFYNLREDMEKLTQASYLLELTNCVITEGQTNNRLFYDLIKCLHILSNMRSNNYDTLIKAYELKMLMYSGLRPELNFCVCCGKQGDDPFNFSIIEGGLLCLSCNQEDGKAVKISNTAINVMRYLLETDLMIISRLKIKTPILNELNKLLKPYMAAHIDKIHFKSLAFLNTIKESKY